MTTTQRVRSYDAVSLLGFGTPSAEPIPEPAEGEIAIRYGGWSLQELRDSRVGQQLMHRQGWYDSQLRRIESLPPDLYYLRIPVPGSNRKTSDEQEAMLTAEDAPAPVALLATALLCHKLQTGEELMMNDCVRCKERATNGDCVSLTWLNGRFSVSDYWGDYRDGRVWLASVRRTS